MSKGGGQGIRKCQNSFAALANTIFVSKVARCARKCNVVGRGGGRGITKGQNPLAALADTTPGQIPRIARSCTKTPIQTGRNSNKKMEIRPNSADAVGSQN